jgi:hypothetical protein
MRNRYAYKMLVGEGEGKRPLEDVGVDGTIILTLVVKKYCVKMSNLSN